MSETTQTTDDAQPETVDVADRGETLEVPTTIAYNDLATHYGSVPDEIRVDRIFRYDDIVRAEMCVDDGTVEVGYFREDDFRPGTEVGWVAEQINTEMPDDLNEGPGETLWSRDQ